MVEDEALKRLLAAESRAEQIVAQAEQERKAVIEQAKLAAHDAQVQRAQHAGEILASFTAQAEQRAAQTIAELKQRYTGRAAALTAAAQLTRAPALDAALALMLDPEKRRL